MTRIIASNMLISVADDGERLSVTGDDGAEFFSATDSCRRTLIQMQEGPLLEVLWRFRLEMASADRRGYERGLAAGEEQAARVYRKLMNAHD